MDNDLEASLISIVHEEKSSQPSILLYSHDGFGLGHLRRNFTIAGQTSNLLSVANILLLTGHPSVPFGPLPYGVDFIKLPSIVKVATGQWQPQNLSINQHKFREIRAKMIQKIAELFHPDIFLVDYTPLGVWSELLPTLQMLKSVKKPATVILGLREILDDPSVTRALWEKEGNYEAIRKYYDRVFIYGVPEIYDTAGQYGFAGDLKKKVSYCGYLCSRASFHHSPERIRAELGIEKEKLIVITAGGGRDAFPMMRLCSKALGMIARKQNFKAILITGPLMSAHHRISLERWSPKGCISILESVRHVADYLNAADLIITMGGYNTMVDAVSAKKPTLVIPREGPSTEQKLRAALFDHLGLVMALDSAINLSVDGLARTIDGQLKNPSFPTGSLDMLAAERIALHISEILVNQRLNKTFGPDARHLA